jgi:chromosomal replication initiator protein
VVGGLFTIPFDPQRSPAGKRTSRSRSLPLIREYIGDDANALVEVAAADLVRPSHDYSPISFVGRKGMGKSLLVQGLAARLMTIHNRREVYLYSGTDFARAVGLAYETNDLTELRRRWSSAAALIIDDVQQLVGKTAAQEELTYVLDAFGSPPRPLVLSLSRPPTEIAGLQAGIASRILGGLVVPLHAPGPEARLEIVRRLAMVHQLNLAPEALLVLAQRQVVGRDGDDEGGPADQSVAARFSVERVAQLLGRLRSVLADEEPLPEPLDLPTVRQILGRDLMGSPPDLRSITSAVAKYFDQRVEDLHGPARRKELVQARGVAMYLARRLTSKSLGQVGKHFGNRDHTTVLHACRKTAQLVEQDAALRKAVEDLTTQFTGT